MQSAKFAGIATFEWGRNERKGKDQNSHSVAGALEVERARNGNRASKGDRALGKRCGGIAPLCGKCGFERGVGTHPPASGGVAARILHPPGTMAARADCAAPAASVHTGFCGTSF